MEGSSQKQSKGQGNVQEVIGDLFSCPDDHALAHCISSDIKMGKGINVLFKKKFHGVQELLDQYQYPGGCAILERGGRFIYYLVTKMYYYQKPTYETLRQSLEKMRNHNLDNGVKQLAMPKIGCGMDKLNWHEVRRCINDVYKGTDVSITVYDLDGDKTGQYQPGQGSMGYNGGRTDKGGSYQGQRGDGKWQGGRQQQQDMNGRRENSGGYRLGGRERERQERRSGGDWPDQHRRGRSGDRRENQGSDRRGGGEKDSRDGGDRSEQQRRASSDDRKESSGGDHQGGGEKDRPEKRKGGERSEEHPRASSDDHGEGTSQRREDAPKEYNSGRNDDEEGKGGSLQRDEQKSSQDKRDDSKHHDDQERDKQASDETGTKKKRKKNKKKKSKGKNKTEGKDGFEFDEEVYKPNLPE